MAYTLCAPAKARGLDNRRVRAAYGMQSTIATIAPAFQASAPKSEPKIAQATWVYRPNMTKLVKGKS